MEKYTIEQLEGKTLFELRDIAKEVGTPSFSNKRKSEIIDLIIRTTNSELATPERPRRGRPPKVVDKREEENLNIT